MNAYSYDNLKRILSTARGQRLVSQIKEGYRELFEGKPIERATYADFMYIFEKNGDTRTYDIIDTQRTIRFACLQILALDDDKYIGDLEEMIAEFCEQYAWFSSYHGRNDAAQTFNYYQIDLDTASVSMRLSMTYGIMKDKLRNDIKIRIRRELERRVIRPFENDPSMFGLDGGCNSNWVTTQTAGVTAAYLYVFPERLPQVKDRLFASIRAFLTGLTDDGYSSEGRGYWFAGFASMSNFLDQYAQNTGEDITCITKDIRVVNGLKFGRYAMLKYGIGLPFADHQDGVADKTTKSAGGNVQMRRVFGDDYAMFSTYDGNDIFVRDENGKLVSEGLHRGDIGYFHILALDTFEEYAVAEEAKNGTYIFPLGGAYIANRDKYSFVAKGGHNAENHNHNDIGTFALFADGKRIFPDVRSHKYDAIYFGPQRYSEEVFAAGSMGHSVPIVDGKYQMPGKDYRGVITDSSDDAFEVNISGAYDTEIISLKVRYELSEDTIKVKYTIDEPKTHTLKLRFIAGYEPKNIENGFDVCGVKLVSVQGLPCEAKRVDYLGHHVDVTVYTLDFDAGSVKNGEFTFEIKIG